jgi:hypothetical protein
MECQLSPFHSNTVSNIRIAASGICVQVQECNDGKSGKFFTGLLYITFGSKRPESIFNSNANSPKYLSFASNKNLQKSKNNLIVGFDHAFLYLSYSFLKK